MFLQELHDRCGPFPVEGPGGTRVVEPIETEGPQHPYLSVGTPLPDVVFGDRAFRLADHYPVTRAERKMATVAAVEGRGAWGSYINELLIKRVVGRGMPGYAGVIQKQPVNGIIDFP
ncbi:hypothetical protein DL764_008437 [Monosporascus ibericus]|uniref:Uncharacterized protein n=1 Tax=Monosporascus ibericus TaxID=155417 RepID=A0A4Q4SZR1_9PEZI|nr:hypothetical protein DL764_008437 [Monosporascus ibericus]